MCARKCGIVACLLLPLAAGCMNTGHVIRSQSPDSRPPRVQHAGGFSGDTSGRVQQLGYPGGTCPPGQPGCGQLGCQPGGQCPTCGDCTGQCPHKCPCDCRNGPGGAWYPTHQHWFDYEAPRNLMYPPANVPPAVVVYPYYTLKGPDDFFKAF